MEGDTVEQGLVFDRPCVGGASTQRIAIDLPRTTHIGVRYGSEGDEVDRVDLDQRRTYRVPGAHSYLRSLPEPKGNLYVAGYHVFAQFPAELHARRLCSRRLHGNGLPGRQRRWRRYWTPVRSRGCRLSSMSISTGPVRRRFISVFLIHADVHRSVSKRQFKNGGSIALQGAPPRQGFVRVKGPTCSLAGDGVAPARQHPARAREMAGVAVRVPLQIILVLGFGLPERACRHNLCHDLAGPQS
jgi:hypothetical protein